MIGEDSIKIEYIEEKSQIEDQISPNKNYDLEIYHNKYDQDQNIEFPKSKKSSYGNTHHCKQCGKSFPQSATLRSAYNLFTFCCLFTFILSSILFTFLSFY